MNWDNHPELIGYICLNPVDLPLGVDKLSFITTWLREVAEDLEMGLPPSEQYLFTARRPEKRSVSGPRKIRKGGV